MAVKNPTNEPTMERYLYGPAVDALLSRTDASGVTNWYLADRLGSVRDIVDVSGNVVYHTGYDSFGNNISTSGSGGDRFGFTGREHDAALNLYYYRARFYDPTTGRFLSKDPLGYDAGDANLYRYVGNGPTNGTDPSGTVIIFPVVIAIGGILIGPSIVNAPNLGDKTYPPNSDLNMFVGVTSAYSAYQAAQAAQQVPRAAKSFQAMMLRRKDAVQIVFGNNPNQVYHTFRYIDGVIDRKKVINAITRDLKRTVKAEADMLIERTIDVDGKTITYHAYLRSNGMLNVGRITLPPPP